MKKKEVKVQSIIDFLKEDLIAVYGDIAHVFVDNVADVEHINATTLDWINPRRPNQQEIAENTPAKVMLATSKVDYSEKMKALGKVLLIVNKPRLMLAKIIAKFFVEKPQALIHPSAIIDEEAVIDPSAAIGAGCIIGKVSIGKGTVLKPKVVLYDDVTIGDNCLIHAGTVIGTDGLGCSREADGTLVKFPHLGGVVIGNNVERIGEQAFKDCNGMLIATLGNKVRTIGEKAFYGCSKLTDFTFGKRVETAEMYAFGSCKALVKITSRAVTPPYLKGKSIFPDKVYNNAIVYVPRQSVDAYKEALVWKYFSIEGVNFMLMNADVNGDGEVNISDVTAVIDILLEGGIDDVGDVNEDDEVNISDINAVVDIILTGN